MAVAEIEREVGALPTVRLGNRLRCARVDALRADWLQHGALLAIDYGFPRREYYHPAAPDGTVMCHYRHHAHADAFWLPGLNDSPRTSTSVRWPRPRTMPVCSFRVHISGALSAELRPDRSTERWAYAAEDECRAIASCPKQKMGELFKVLAVGRGNQRSPGRL